MEGRRRLGAQGENEWEKETSLPHGERRGPYTERQWYDERIGGRSWDVRGGEGEDRERGSDKLRAAAKEEGKWKREPR